ncbi:MAG: hypothetical protein HYX93_05125 [Chloroflexi bacterium]|nr:hypothetical protein [Chloroflexota bacterium]
MIPTSGADQVRLATFESEPLARLCQQRLREEGIPSVVRSLGAGSGAWGGSAFVPHAIYVMSRDRRRAVGVLAGTDSPEYLLDTGIAAEESPGRMSGFLLAAAVTMLAIAVLSAVYTALR